MKKVLFLMILLFLIVSGTATMNAQVKIGENTIPRKGAVLDLNGSYKGGLLLPYVEITDMGKIPNDFHDTSVAGEDEVPALAGLLVWNTGTGSEGVYVWDGKDWQVVSGGSVTPPQECPAPATPGAITFDPASIKVGETTTATCGVVDGATSYVWTLPDGLTADPLVTTTNKLIITGTTVTNYIPGSVKVKTINACGESDRAAMSSESLDVSKPGAGSTALGWSIECANTNKSACTCSVGVPVAYHDADSAMQESVKKLDNARRWYDNTTDSDSHYRSWSGSVWTYYMTGAGYMVCF